MYKYLFIFRVPAENHFPVDIDKGSSFNLTCTEQPASDFFFNAVQDVEDFNALERDLEDSAFRGKLVKKFFYISSIYLG